MKRVAIAGSVLLGAVCLVGAGCSSDSNNGGSGGTGGSGGSGGSTGGRGGGGGSSGSGGTGGSSSTGGSTGTGGSSGSGGSAGSGGSGGSAGSGGTGGTGGSAGSGGSGGGDAKVPDMAGDGPRAEGGGMSSGMSFFVTSTGTGMMGGNMGGLAGADMKCQMLAEAAGVMGKTWRAYLSADAAGGMPAVNARDRIGTGPWVNQKGVTVATSVDNLHSNNNMLGAANSIDEKGAAVPNNQHDIMTGSTADGMLQANATCNNWTSNQTMHVGRVGHHNKMGGGQSPNSWNSAHNTPNCTQASIVQVAGAARTYCFATN